MKLQVYLAMRYIVKDKDDFPRFIYPIPKNAKTYKDGCGEIKLKNEFATVVVGRHFDFVNTFDFHFKGRTDDLIIYIHSPYRLPVIFMNALENAVRLKVSSYKDLEELNRNITTLLSSDESDEYKSKRILELVNGTISLSFDFDNQKFLECFHYYLLTSR